MHFLDIFPFCFFKIVKYIWVCLKGRSLRQPFKYTLALGLPSSTVFGNDFSLNHGCLDSFGAFKHHYFTTDVLISKAFYCVCGNLFLKTSSPSLDINNKKGL